MPRSPFPNGANSGLALDGAGNIYATAANAIEKLTPAPGNTFTATAAVTGLLNPAAVAIDGAGNLYVADQGLYPTPASVVKFTLQQDGTYLEIHPRQRLHPTDRHRRR